MSGPYRLTSDYVDEFHQHLWLTVKPSGDLFEEVRQTINVSVKMNGPTSTSRTYRRQKTIHCIEQVCNQLILFHLNKPDQHRYQFEIQFDGIEQLNQKKIVNFQFFLNTFNPKYTKFELTFRFIFLVGSIFAACLFTKSMCRFSIRDWSLEQRWMVALLLLLIFYNGPLFPATFLTVNSFPILADGIFQETFLSFLLLFWLSIFHGIRQNNRRFISFYLPKLVLLFLLWLLSIVILSQRVIEQFADPTSNLVVDIHQFTTFQLTFYLLAILYILYLVFLIVRAFGELRGKPFFDIRLKFTTILMVCVVSMSIFISALRFGSSIFSENFVPEFSSHYKNSVEFLSFYSLINFYLYTMAYVYSPAKNAAIDSLFRDNPTFSMVNDSDEDVSYGSDHESSRLTSM